MFDQINAALISKRDLFQKHLTDHKPLNGIYSMDFSIGLPKKLNTELHILNHVLKHSHVLHQAQTHWNHYWTCLLWACRTCADHKDLSHPHMFVSSGENDLFLAGDIPICPQDSWDFSRLRARRSRPAAFHVQQDIRQESQIVLLWMRGAHATGSPQQRQACVPPSAPCQKVNHQHMLEITFMFTAEDILCQTNAKLNVIHLRVVHLPGHLPAELP